MRSVTPKCKCKTSNSKEVTFLLHPVVHKGRKLPPLWFQVLQAKATEGSMHHGLKERKGTEC